MKKLLCLSLVFAGLLLPAVVFAVTANSIVGKWGYTALEHDNGGSWGSTSGTCTFNSDGTGTDVYKSNNGGILTSKTKNFTYTTTENSDGSFTLTQTYADGIDTLRIVLSDDGNMFIMDGTSDTSGQFMVVGIKMDTSKTYTNADLNGNYYMMGYEHNGTYTTPPYGNGSYMAVSSTATFDGNGNCTDSFTANSDGTIWNDSDSRTYSVNSDGSFSMAGGLGYISGNGKVSVASSPQRTYKWIDYIFMKKGDITYSTAGAAGTWAIVGFGDSSGTSFNADFGTITCDSSGNCTYSFKNQKDGSTTYESGSFTISVSSDGSMTTSFTSGAPSYAVAVGNNGNTLIVNDSLDQSVPRKIYIGVRCSTCSNLTGSLSLTLTPPSNTTVSKGSKLGPFSISIKNNTSSSSTFYAYIYLVTPDGNWRSLISKSLTLSGGGTLTANNLYMNIPSFAPTGTYYYWVGIYDTSYNLLDDDSFAFTVTSSSSKSGRNHDWGVSGWPNN